MDHYGHLTNIRSKGRQGDLSPKPMKQRNRLCSASFGIRRHPSAFLPGIREIGPDVGLQWMVDPLDGTTNFAHGYPFFATSIGLCWNGRPLLGTISALICSSCIICPGVGALQRRPDCGAV